MSQPQQTAPAGVGIVVIGRNEGERLRQCLRSVHGAGYPVVYVDSGSRDGSVALAHQYADRVLELDPARPFSAARARNEGFALLCEAFPAVRFVQFLDGDCVAELSWLDVARRALDEDAGRAAVIGDLSEANADATPYNRLCALEWRSPPGDLTNFGALGGLFMVRAEVFRALGGFNPDVIAGEDSEFGVRMSLAGYRVTKIRHPMATHDANMTRFAQWWKRAVRAGHAIGQRAHLNGASPARDCVRERKSTWVWGIGLPLAVLLLALPTGGASLFLLPAGYGLLGARVFRYRRTQGDDAGEALLYARFLILSKLANGIGLLTFHANKLARRYEIIEYK